MKKAKPPKATVPSKTATAKSEKALPATQHKRHFNQLLDDAVFGVTKKK